MARKNDDVIIAIPADMIAKVDDMRRKWPEIPTRSFMVRQLLRTALAVAAEKS